MKAGARDALRAAPFVHDEGRAVCEISFPDIRNRMPVSTRITAMISLGPPRVRFVLRLFDGRRDCGAESITGNRRKEFLFLADHPHDERDDSGDHDEQNEEILESVHGELLSKERVKIRNIGL